MANAFWLDLTKVLLTVVAAVWAYFRFVRERSHARRVAFSIECKFFGPLQGSHAAEFTLRIKNHGLVVHRFSALRLRVRGIRKENRLECWVTQPSRLKFPEKLFDEPDVLFSQKYGHIFVEPGVEQVITFVAPIPDSIALILARAEFEYSDARTHSTERVFTPSTFAPNASQADSRS